MSPIWKDSPQKCYGKVHELKILGNHRGVKVYIFSADGVK